MSGPEGSPTAGREWVVASPPPVEPVPPPTPPAHRPGRRARYGWLVVVAVVVLVVVGLVVVDDLSRPHSGGAPPPAGPGPPAGVAKFLLDFTENGLPSGTVWQVDLSGTSEQGSEPTLQFLEPNGTYEYTVLPITGYSTSDAEGVVAVNGSGADLAISFSSLPTYSVTLVERGLPVGSLWGVTIGGATTNGTDSILTTRLPNGTYNYTVDGPHGYLVPTVAGSFTIDGSPVQLGFNFTRSPAPAFPVTFSASGVPVGTNWSVTLGDQLHTSTSATLEFQEPNGTYPYTAGFVPNYTVDPAYGTLTVAGRATSVDLTYEDQLPGSGGSWPVTATQTGLPSNVTWGLVLFTGPPPYPNSEAIAGELDEGPSGGIALPNGTYHYEWIVNYYDDSDVSYAPQTSSGNFTVAGKPVGIAVRFLPLLSTAREYTVTLSEYGAPANVTWTAFLAGYQYTAPAGTAIEFNVSNGTYVPSATTTATGFVTWGGPTIVVDGGPTSGFVRFVYEWRATFIESGLNDTSWTLLVAGGEYSGTEGTSSYSLEIPNGSYTYDAWAIGYTGAPLRGALLVDGAPTWTNLTFVPVATFNVTFREAGLPAGADWYAFVETDVTGGDEGNSAFGNSSVLTVDDLSGNSTWVAETNEAEGYWASPETGAVDVDVAGLVVNLTFVDQPGTRLVIFDNLGLNPDDLSFGFPAGANWSVTLNGTTETTTGLYLAFHEPNGTYSYSVTGPADDTPVISGGTLTVDEATTNGVGAEVILDFFAGSALPPNHVGHVAEGQGRAVPDEPPRRASVADPTDGRAPATSGVGGPVISVPRRPSPLRASPATGP